MPPLSILDLSVVITARPPAQATAPSSRNRARLSSDRLRPSWKS